MNHAGVPRAQLDPQGLRSFPATFTNVDLVLFSSKKEKKNRIERDGIQGSDNIYVYTYSLG